MIFFRRVQVVYAKLRLREAFDDAVCLMEHELIGFATVIRHPVLLLDLRQRKYVDDAILAVPHGYIANQITSLVYSRLASLRVDEQVRLHLTQIGEQLGIRKYVHC